MLTGDFKNRVDRVWATFWNNGISSPLTIIVQISYLPFIKRLEDEELAREARLHARFVERSIDFLTQNGVMSPGLLYEPPFTDSHPDGVDGVFRDSDADNIISIVRSFNATVGAVFSQAV